MRPGAALFSGFLGLLLFLAAAAVPADARETARDLTARCSLRSVTEAGEAVPPDGGAPEGALCLEVVMPPGEPCSHIYLTFRGEPVRAFVQAPSARGWDIVSLPAGLFAHLYLPVPGLERFRLVFEPRPGKGMALNSLQFFGAGELPFQVQRWEPPAEQNDLLVLAGHPDDEYIYFGGTIPTYAGERKLKVAVACLTCPGDTRRSELLNGLWHCGLRAYPDIGDFRDVYTTSLKDLYRLWGQKKTVDHVASLYRRYRPSVVLTHALSGEYGHAVHKAAADAALKAVAAAADGETPLPRAGGPGPWQVSKLYLHMGQKSPIRLDWRTPLAAFGGRSAHDVAQEALNMHVSQGRRHVSAEDRSTSASRFWLAFSAVGEDVFKNDFLENVLPLSEGGR